MFSKLLSREFIFVGLTGTGSAFCLFELLRNSFWMERFVKFKTKFGPDNEPVTVSGRSKFILNECMDALKLTEWNKHFIKSFICKDLDPIHLGSIHLKSGVYIGTPEYFQISKDQIKESNIRVDGKQINWDSAEGKQFLESLVLSDNAKKFAIAKQVLIAQSFKIIFLAIFPNAFLISFYGFASKAHKMFDLQRKPVISSIFVHTIIGIFTYFLYLFVLDSMELLYDTSVEQQVYQLGGDYINGGIEYYSKKLERNKALRELSVKGQKKFSVSGNETNIFRTTGLPLTHKLKLAEEELKTHSITKKLKSE